MKRKAQAEIIGLVIIVIMITMGMLFMAQFAIKENPEKKIFTRKGLAYSSMSAIMKTTVWCPEISTSLSIGTELLEDCAKYYNDPDSGFICEGLHSCDFLKEKIDLMLTATLGEWNKDYQLQSNLMIEPVRELINIDRGSCLTSQEKDSSGLFPIYVRGAGLVQSTIFLCN